jgi:hypothetical protein
VLFSVAANRGWLLWNNKKSTITSLKHLKLSHFTQNGDGVLPVDSSIIVDIDLFYLTQILHTYLTASTSMKVGSHSNLARAAYRVLHNHYRVVFPAKKSL